jgi:transcriptional regulator with XRE-family HTH domain
MWQHPIREGRRAKGMTQVELAEALGITQQAVSEWEAGRKTPSNTMKAALLDVLDIDPVDVLPEWLAGRVTAA